ncbi:MAG: phenylacetate--CoA ligase family protein [Gammaproteobacteria bacterium]
MPALITTPFDMVSAVPEQAWPALPGAEGAMLAALNYQFAHSERLPPDELHACQLAQARCLVEHARRTVPYYRERFAGIDVEALDATTWARLPLLPRRALQQAGERLRSERLPAGLGETYESRTSGSTGEPVVVRRSGLDRLMSDAMTLREHYWHGRDFAAHLAAIRAFDGDTGAPPTGTLNASWGAPASLLHHTGPLSLLALNTDVARQVDWLTARDPDYLVTYPNNLAALLDHAERHGWRLPRLRAVRTVGETVSAALRARCNALWGLELVDLYSSRELGTLALQCPVSGLYHVAAETHLLEILDDHDQPVAAGAVGRVVVTSLHNYAMPLIRYEINDHAEAGPPCPCGRSLPTLRRILGRSRHMLTLPDGRRHWPLLGFAGFRDVAPVVQYQVVQHAPRAMEFRLVVERPLTTAEEAGLGTLLNAALGHPFELRFRYFEGVIPRGPGGKFEEFIGLDGASAG